MTHARSRRSLVAMLLTFAMLLSVFTGILTITASAESVDATLTFDDKAKRTAFSSTQQIWQENGITLTNDKASSTNAVADYAAPARFYASSTLTIEAPGNITKIVFNCNRTSDATNLGKAITGSTVSSKVVTVTLDGSAATYTVSLSGGQVRMDGLTVTYEKSADAPEIPADCEHPNTTTTTTEATKVNDGMIVTRCDDCGAIVESQVIPALGCVVTFEVPDGATAPTHGDTLTVTLPDAVEAPASYNAQDYTFAGWSKESIADTSKDPKIYAAGEKVSITKDTTFYAVYTYSKIELVEEAGGLVAKDITEISADDAFVITMTKADGTIYALPSNNGSSAAPGATVFDINATAIADDLKWTLEATDSGYVFHPNGDASKWLYCTNTNTGVRVGTGTAKHFVVEGTYLKMPETSSVRYVGIYNTQDWRCYTSTTGSSNIKDQTLALYVIGSGSGNLVEAEVTYYTTTPATVDLPEIGTASVTLGSDLKMNFYVPAASETLNIGMTVAMNGNTYILEGVYADGRFCFTFAGIAPQCMGDEITATLTFKGEVVSTKTTSVRDYAIALLEQNPEDSALAALVGDMLAYGAAAQLYANHNVDDLVNADYEELATNAAPAGEKHLTASTADVKFKSATVLFDSVNKIAVKLTATDGVVVKVDGVEMVLAEDGYYYTEGIKALNFNKNYVFTIEIDGEVVQTLTYSVNAYTVAMQNSTNTEMKDLATALYNYGASAEAYKNAQNA